MTPRADSSERGRCLDGNASAMLLLKSIFGLLGVGILLPWNAFVSAKPYFEARLCSGDSSSGNIELWFGVVYNFSSVLSLGGMIVIQWMRDKNGRAASCANEETSQLELNLTNESLSDQHETTTSQDRWMVMAPLCVYLAVFLLTTGLVTLVAVPRSAFLAFTLVGLFVCGACTAFASAGIVGTAGLFPANIGTQSYFAGQAVGGVAVALANLVAAVLRDSQEFRDEHCYGGSDRIRLEEDMPVTMTDGSPSCIPYRHVDWSSFAYFLAGTLVLGMCIIGYSYIESYKRSEMRAQYETLDEVRNEEVIVASREKASVAGGSREEGSVAGGDIEMPSGQAEVLALERDRIHVTTNAGLGEPTRSEGRSTAAVWRVVKGPACTICLTFFVTLSLFPGWTSQLQSVRECQSGMRIQNDLYTPLTFVTFNVGDLLGRIASGKVLALRIEKLSGNLLVVSVCRFLFFPLFLFCAARDTAFGNRAIQSDLFSFAVQISFASLNGLLTSLSFMHAQELLELDSELQTKASVMLNFALSLGLTCGSFFSFPFSRVATGHW